MRGLQPRSSTSSGSARAPSKSSARRTSPPAAAMESAVTPPPTQSPTVAPLVPRSLTPARLSMSRRQSARSPLTAAQGNGRRPVPSAASGAARAVRRSDMAPLCPAQVAATKGEAAFRELPPSVGKAPRCPSGLAWCSNNTRKTSSSPASAARASAVPPSAAARSTVALCSQSQRTTAGQALPFFAASISGVAPLLSRASRSARAINKDSRSPRSAPTPFPT
mmetsp:Transcript_86500/g.185350  ORF Transcript_86500/g.185350 Transcript_86500/m.185350 type:complete len:222 (+) Transcript_86500:455-1120(+)